MKRRLVLGLLGIVLLPSSVICSPLNADYSGSWKLDNQRSAPQRGQQSGEVTLRIEQHPSLLIVETTILHSTSAPRHALQRYTLDGKQSKSTGADGDEFLTAVHPDSVSLVFSIEEHEDGRTILWDERWRLIDNGKALERVRERSSGEKQTLVYLRQAQ